MTTAVWPLQMSDGGRNSNYRKSFPSTTLMERTEHHPGLTGLEWGVWQSCSHEGGCVLCCLASGLGLLTDPIP